MPSANNAPGNGSFAARISNFFATDLLPQLLKLSKDFLDQGDQRQFFNFELEFHKQALQFSDRVTEQALLEKICNPELIEQATKHYQAKGFHVHSRKKSTTVQLYGGETFAEATENLERHGVDLSEKRVRTISETVGATALQERATKIEQFNKGQPPAGDAFAGQNVVVAIDGGRTRMRQTKTGKKKKGQKRQGFYTGGVERAKTLYHLCNR